MIAVGRASGSLPAVLAWGIGLILLGLAVIGFGLGFLSDYRGIASKYRESLVASRRMLPVVGGQAERITTTHVRIFVGIGIAFIGLVTLSVGILGRTAI